MRDKSVATTFTSEVLRLLSTLVRLVGTNPFRWNTYDAFPKV